MEPRGLEVSEQPQEPPSLVVDEVGEGGSGASLILMAETLCASLKMDPKTREAKQARLALLEQYSGWL